MTTLRSVGRVLGALSILVLPFLFLIFVIESVISIHPRQALRFHTSSGIPSQANTSYLELATFDRESQLPAPDEQADRLVDIAAALDLPYAPRSRLLADW